MNLPRRSNTVCFWDVASFILYEQKTGAAKVSIITTAAKPMKAELRKHLNSCELLDSETNRKSFPFKEELEAFKAQVISEIKNLILKELCFKRSYHHAFQH